MNCLKLKNYPSGICLVNNCEGSPFNNLFSGSRVLRTSSNQSRSGGVERVNPNFFGDFFAISSINSGFVTEKSCLRGNSFFSEKF